MTQSLSNPTFTGKIPIIFIAKKDVNGKTLQIIPFQCLNIPPHFCFHRLKIAISMVKHSQTTHVQIPIHKIHMFDMVNIGFCLWFFAIWFFAMRVCLKI